MFDMSRFEMCAFHSGFVVAVADGGGGGVAVAFVVLNSCHNRDKQTPLEKERNGL